MDNGAALQAGPAAGLGRHHRPCRILGHRRSNSRWQPRTSREPSGQAMVRDVQEEPAGRGQSRHRSRRLHADRQACVQREQAYGGGLGARHRGGREVEPAGRFHHASRLRMDVRARRQQSSSHRRFPRQRGPREARSFPSPPSTARIPRSCGSTWTRTRRRPAAMCSPSRTTATSAMAMMYSAETFDGKPMDRAYAEARAGHEPLVEATQIKGDGETNPYPLAERRVRQFRTLGLQHSKMDPAEKERAPLQLHSLGAQAGTGAGSQARGQPLQVRHDRRQRCPRWRGHHAGRQLLRRVCQRIAVAGPLENSARHDQQ